MARSRWSLLAAIVTLVVAVTGSSAVGGVGCQGSPVFDRIGGYENSALRRGTRADIYVNNFQQNQYDSWRQVSILLNSNNWAEAGWFSTLGGTPHPFKSWKNGGVFGEQHLSANLSTDMSHEFKVHDANGNRHWSFAYDGNAMGDEFVDFNVGESISQAERNCTSDSLFANFRNLDRITCVGCTWTNYQSLYQYVNSTPGSGNAYEFCRLSNTGYNVRQSCP